MKIWYALLVLFAVTLYLARSGALSHHDTSPALLPGNPVDARIARGALVVDGDPVDPLLEARLQMISPASAEVAFESAFSSGSRALFFFKPEPGGTYKATLRTKYRHLSITLEAAAQPPPEEILRLPLAPAAAVDEPVGVGFDSGETNVIVTFGSGHAQRVALDSGKIETLSAPKPVPRESKAISPSGHFIAILQPPAPTDAMAQWQLIVLH